MARTKVDTVSLRWRIINRNDHVTIRTGSKRPHDLELAYDFLRRKSSVFLPSPCRLVRQERTIRNEHTIVNAIAPLSSLPGRKPGFTSKTSPSGWASQPRRPIVIAS